MNFLSSILYSGLLDDPYYTYVHESIMKAIPTFDITWKLHNHCRPKFNLSQYESEFACSTECNKQWACDQKSC